MTRPLRPPRRPPTAMRSAPSAPSRVQVLRVLERLEITVAFWVWRAGGASGSGGAGGREGRTVIVVQRGRRQQPWCRAGIVSDSPRFRPTSLRAVIPLSDADGVHAASRRGVLVRVPDEGRQPGTPRPD